MPELYPEDQVKVDQYLATDVHRVKRKPFRPWLLLAILLFILAGLSGLAYWVSALHGFV